MHWSFRGAARALVPSTLLISSLSACESDDKQAIKEDASVTTDPSTTRDASADADVALGDASVVMTADGSVTCPPSAAPCPPGHICAEIMVPSSFPGTPKQITLAVYATKPDVTAGVALPTAAYAPVAMPSAPYRVEVPIQPVRFGVPAGKLFVAATVYASDEMFVPKGGVDYFAASKNTFDFDDPCVSADAGKIEATLIPVPAAMP